MTDKQFAAHAQKGTVPEHAAVRKGMVADVEQEDEDLTLRFVISAASVDRDRDVISVEGWDLKDYKRNSVIAWSHDYTLPAIGRSKRTWIEDGKLKSIAEFTPKDLNPFGYMIYGLYKGGFMHATSVGFAPGEWTYDEKRGGVNFKNKHSLLEYSAVLVPANADALIERSMLAEAKASGLDVAPMREWLEKAHAEITDEPGLWLPKAQVEAAFAAISTQKTISVPAPVSIPESVAEKAPTFKGKPECPLGITCANETNADTCPAVHDCPMAGPALAATVPEVTKDALTLELEDGLILELAEADPSLLEYDDAVLRRTIAEVVRAGIHEHLLPEIQRRLRDELTAATGRLD